MANTHATLQSLFTDIANAIRAKTGNSAQIKADNFPSAIASIPTSIDPSDATATSSDILSGKTAYVGSGKITGNILQKTAQIFTPSTSDQTIASGVYLAGTQTIKGDANLLAENIKYGTNIFGITGSYNKPASLPIASIGDELEINGLNFICIGENRYAYMGSLGILNWSNSMAMAQSRLPYTFLQALYNISNQSLISLEEAQALTENQLKDIYLAAGAAGRNVWLETEYSIYGGKQAYVIMKNTSGQYLLGVSSITTSCVCVPAFTISVKE